MADNMSSNDLKATDSVIIVIVMVTGGVFVEGAFGIEACYFIMKGFLV